MQGAVLVTGGAGYIGSHTVRRLLEDNRRVVVLDNLSTGHREVMSLFSRVYGPKQFCFEEVNLLDADSIQGVFEDHEIVGIIDFAARSLVAESQKTPRLYFDNNVIAFMNLITASHDVPVVKSSTAATYGDPDDENIPLVETYQRSCVDKNIFPDSQLMEAAYDFDTIIGWYNQEIAGKNSGFELTEENRSYLRIPTNVYGITKVMDEIILDRCDVDCGRHYISLRYFNAAGADSSRLIGEDHNPETHLIPIVLQVVSGKRDKIKIFGNEYETRDGTAVRDYISVQDLAEAHVLCMDHLIAGGSSKTYNLGSGLGYSVKEIIETARKVTGHPIPAEDDDPRSGDPATLIANSNLIKEEMGWEVKASLEEIIESAWHWHRLNPEGYQVKQEERFNPFWNRWVNIAAHRSSRPWSGETQSMDSGETKKYDEDCYLCPKNTRVKGDVNPDYSSVWTFVNDFSTLVMDAYETSEEHGPYKAHTSKGICEVIVYSRDHSQMMSTMYVDEIANVVDEWAKIYQRLGEIEEIKYPLIFENRGNIMGNSQPHPHGQVYAYGSIPDLILKPQLEVIEDYKDKNDGNCFVCDANKFEIEDSRRILAKNDSMVAYVPYAAQFPYDVMIVPITHASSLLELDKKQRMDLAGILKRVLNGLDELFKSPYHYSLALIQTPTDDIDYDFHMQLHITSLLRGPGLRKHVVGADIFGRLINPSDPNHTAEEIRHAMRQHYRS
ncbi:galactose-1-phosphate uridylyltransferase [Candidatus Poribacteria bacterium]|nr:galactose-1-phosphate uridylyltransferase [Candidatus Poribacteria bacterium]